MPFVARRELGPLLVPRDGPT